MVDLKGARILVAGAGAAGSAVAVHLAQCGADVTLIDPASAGDSASGVAAGMLAPALEAVSDAVSADHFQWLKAGRDLWPDFLRALHDPRTAVEHGGALWLGDGADLERTLASLHAAGAAAERISADQARRLSPGLRVAGDCLFSAEDWRLEPQILLETMRQAFERSGGQIERRRLMSAGPGAAMLDRRERRAVDWVVFAGGHPARGALGLAPELAMLKPIKGQILRFTQGSAPAAGPILRAAGIYLAPSGRGAMAGSTMEFGRNNRRLDEAVAEAQRAAAATLFPGLAEAPADMLAGVRSTSPDGLPMVGLSAAPGVILATGLRRNGWLLAPMVARAVAAVAAGQPVAGPAAAFDPRRFG